MFLKALPVSSGATLNVSLGVDTYEEVFSVRFKRICVFEMFGLPVKQEMKNENRMARYVIGKLSL